MDIKQKKNKLSNFKKEVDDLHPILEELFRSMKNIKNIEHSHGKSEMGADFILYKLDELFGNIDHIGVIVKLGTIKQDNQDVERQIEECNVERIFKHDNSKGYLNEIWIVSNENITENAQRKIQEKYKNSKVKFIYSDMLITWIDTFIPNYWNEMPIGISTYMSQELSICRSDDTKFSLIDNYPNLYIDLDVIKKNKNRTRKIHNQIKLPREEIVNIFNEIERNSIIIIEGQMGSGKSKMLRKVFEHYCDVSIYNETKIIPIRVSFIDYVDKYDSDSCKLISAVLKEYNNVCLNDVDKFLILVDGVDEYSPNYEEYMKLFNDTIANIKTPDNLKDVMYVFSIRDTDTIDNYSGLQNIRSYEIKPLSIAKLFDMLCTICTEVTEGCRLLEDLKHSELFRDLPNYPMSAILLAKLINEGDYKDLPMTITELYKKYAELCLGRWDIKRGLQKEQEYIIANKFAMALSEYMYKNKTISINRQGAKEIFDNYMNVRNFETTDKEKLYSKIIARTGLFAKIEADSTILFKHRTFIDYFYAQHLHSKNLSILDYNVWSPTYHNITMFYIGIENDCYEILKKIISIEPVKDLEKFYKPIALSDYYLAGYATEYSVVKESLGDTFMTFAQFYQDVIDKKIVLPFSILPEAQILWLFQLIIRDKYSFGYFINALDDACNYIEASNNPNNIKVISLFFVGCIKLELKMQDPFDYLIVYHEKEIPDSVKFLVMKEAEDIIQKSVILKNLTKHIKKEFRKSSIRYRNLLTKPIVKHEEFQKEIEYSD